MTPLVLGGLAVLLAWPVPAILTRVPRLRRTPASAMLLWQSVALAAVLAALGAGLSLATTEAWRRAPSASEYAVAAAALGVTGLVVGRLLLTGRLVGTELRAIRRRHLEQVDLVGRRVSDGALRVLEHELPVAYCLPGLNHSRIVLSSGAVARLSPDGLAAVLAHERAHLRARHDLVLEAFTVLHRAFPRGVSSRAVLEEVSLLAEVLADRSAVRSGPSPSALGQALLAMAQGSRPEGTLGAADTGLVTRVELLGDRRPHRLQSLVVVVAAVAVLAVPTLFVVGPWLASLR